MLSDETSVLVDVEKLYESRGEDIAFEELLNGASGDDEALAELIEADGRCRLLRERPVDLNRYLSAIPDLYARPIALDAAIDVALRAMSGSARAAPHAVEQLIKAHPRIESVIREAATLSMAVWSTSGLREQIGPDAPVKELPCEFGPSMAGGESRYVLQKLLGRGAFGQVYLALDREMSEEGHTALVAIKILVIGSHSPFARDRLIEEATKVRRISHPNVVQVIDRGVTSQNEDYIVYEYVDGGDLGDALLQQPKWPIRKAAELVRKIALGVHAAHAAGVIHCDLKPGNIMLTSKGEPKVADFGVAVRFGENRRALLDQHGSAGALIGNLAFISPEQYRNEPGALSVQSDIYALGGVLHLLLTGLLPNGSTVQEIARTHDAETGRAHAPALRTVRREIDRDLERICQRALAPKPKDRYDSAAALADDLGRWLRLEPIQWMKPSLGRVFWLWSHRKPALAAALALLVIAIVTGVAVAIRLNAIAEHERYEKAVADLKLQQEADKQTFRLGAGDNIIRRFKLLQEHRFNVEALSIIWVLEHLYKSDVLNSPKSLADLWPSRIEIARDQVSAFNEKQQGNHVEALMWETLLAFWLVSRREWREAEPLLHANHEKWRERLTEDDTWLADLEAMMMCAKVCKITEASDSTAIGESTVQALQSLEQQLLVAKERLAESRSGAPVHILVLDTLSTIYGQSYLNQGDRQQQIEGERKTALARTARFPDGKRRPANSPTTAPDSSAESK